MVQTLLVSEIETEAVDFFSNIVGLPVSFATDFYDIYIYDKFCKIVMSSFY